MSNDLDEAAGVAQTLTAVDQCVPKREHDIADAARVIAWAREAQRKPAHAAFTAGPERQAAYWIEWALSQVSESVPTLNDMQIDRLLHELDNVALNFGDDIPGLALNSRGLERSSDVVRKTFTDGTVLLKATEAAHQSIPDGWRIRRDGGDIRITAPDGSPGGMTLSSKERGLPARLLYALCDALLTAESQTQELQREKQQ